MCGRAAAHRKASADALSGSTVPARRIRPLATPKFLTLVDHLAQGIASGRWREGERLPPQRELAAQFGVTIATMTRAVAEATRMGLVIARPGSGTYVRGAEAPEPSGIDLRLNNVPIVPGIRAALAAAMAELGREGDPERLFGYNPGTGAARHRAAAARWVAPRGLTTSAEGLLLSHGAQHGLAACLAALARPGDTVLCEAWTYAGFHRLAAEAGLRLQGVAMDEEGMCPEALARALRETGARLVLCSPAVQNPTTATMGLARRRAILDACRAVDAFVLEDDVCGYLAGDTLPPLAELDPERAVYITGLSKAVAPGFRLGLLRPPARLRAAITQALGVHHWVAPGFYAEVLARLVEAGVRADHRAEVAARMALLAAPLGLRPPLASYHAWLPVPDVWPVGDFVAALAGRGVLVLPAGHFAVAGAPAPRHVRLCLGAVPPEALSRAAGIIAGLAREQPWAQQAMV
ncbi:PLP-dependent aminotransferase family protein [Rhodovarius crocodyli]|uniref:PLP-dependent aminotransferase family protein n=1 Tax=Rhodovarius crocodyli TaxID=1979269 RepID=A0A437MJC5_9PROT|nr:PLP-dependent aminotransferase family protein [Rhodovarius crocodyli]RVT97750.1 PLP-dependent aminotransferase family protein [Rhodovarius crocodyli]